jgi:hypothetical protein
VLTTESVIVAGQREPNEIELAKVRRFFRLLRDKPFITLIMDGDDVHLYSKAISDEEMRTIQAVLYDELEEE